MSLLRRLAIVVAVLLQLVVLVPFTISSGLIAPAWAVAAFVVLWIAAAAVLWQVAGRQPLLAPAVPLANAALLWAAITAGARWLAWTA